MARDAVPFPVRGARALLVLAALAAAPAAIAQESGPPPVAAFKVSPENPEPGREVTASAYPLSKAFPPCDPIARYEWDWDGDSEFEINLTFAEQGFQSVNVLDEEGVHPIALRVTDACGERAVAIVNVTVGNSGLGGRFNWDVVFDHEDAYLRAAWLVLWVSVVVILAGLPLGVAVALLRTAPVAPVRWIAAAYVEILRGTPLLVQIFFAWLALPEIHPALKFTAIESGIIALVVNTSAYQAEVIRAGIQAIPSGQREAALAMGMTARQTMRHVILPQALRLVIPPLTNEFIILIKDTSLLFTIGVIELMATARFIQTKYYTVVEPLIAVAVLYFVMTYTLSVLLQRLERRLRIPGLGLPTGVAHA